MPDQSTEQRISRLENQMAALEMFKREQEAFKREQENRDLALLARIDGFIDDLRRIERVQMRGFEDMKTGQRNIEANVAVLTETAKSHTQAITVLAETAKDHKQVIEGLAGQVNELAQNVKELAGNVGELATGQQEILLLLRGGRQPQND